jgi:hypothetical protein
MSIFDYITGLNPHLQQNEMIKNIAMPRMNMSNEDYNVISAMNAADNMNSGLMTLSAPATLYSLGDYAKNLYSDAVNQGYMGSPEITDTDIPVDGNFPEFKRSQDFRETMGDLGRYLKGVNIQSNPELAKQLMGEDYVNKMQGKYALAMDEIGQGIFGIGPDPSLYGSPSGIMNTGSVRPQGLDTSRFTRKDLESGYLDRAGSYNQNVYAEKPKSFRDSKNLEEYFQNRSPLQGIEKLLQYLPFGEKSLLGYLGDKILPKDSPEIRSMKNFYRSQYGLTDTGQVASGIMAGYNPVSGGLLNMLTGGRFGEPTRFGLANAARQRIENIAKRRAPQTDASRAKIQELQKIAEADTISRARQANQDVYSRAEANKALGPGGGFSTSGREGAFSSKSGRGRQDF